MDDTLFACQYILCPDKVAWLKKRKTRPGREEHGPFCPKEASNCKSLAKQLRRDEEVAKAIQPMLEEWKDRRWPGTMAETRTRTVEELITVVEPEHDKPQTGQKCRRRTRVKYQQAGRSFDNLREQIKAAVRGVSQSKRYSKK